MNKIKNLLARHGTIIVCLFALAISTGVGATLLVREQRARDDAICHNINALKEVLRKNASTRGVSHLLQTYHPMPGADPALVEVLHRLKVLSLQSARRAQRTYAPSEC